MTKEEANESDASTGDHAKPNGSEENAQKEQRKELENAEKDPEPTKKVAVKVKSVESSAHASPEAKETDGDKESNQESSETQPAEIDGAGPQTEAVVEAKEEGDQVSESSSRRERRKSRADSMSTSTISSSSSSRKRKHGSETSSTDQQQQQDQQEAQPAVTKPPGKKRGRKPGKKNAKKKAKQAVEDDSETEDENDSDLHKKIAELDPAISARFGQLVWARMSRYPFWPALVIPPTKLDGKTRASVVANLDSQYWVFFYGTNNFAAVGFKNIADWDDTKNNYREGYPEKVSKAPKRRQQFLGAIEEAENDMKRTVEERLLSLFPEPNKEEAKPKVKPTASTPTEEPPVKRKRGRPPKKETLLRRAREEQERKEKERQERIRAAEAKEAEEEEEAEKSKSKGKKKAKAKNKLDDDDGSETSSETEEEPVPAPLSKEEIKAKVAMRKAPSKKKAASSNSPTKSKSSQKRLPGKAKAGGDQEEIDPKRRKTIELLCPRQSVKSADIREMNEEMTRNQEGKTKGPKDATVKDKVEYEVGPLAAFGSKLSKLRAHESTQNNVEIMKMLQQLFEVKLIYRSDVERSGLASIVAALRKSTVPNIAETASKLRKHLIGCLVDDTTANKKTGEKNKATTSAEPPMKSSKRRKTQASENASDDASSSSSKKEEAKKHEASDVKDQTKPEDTESKNITPKSAEADAKLSPSDDKKCESEDSKLSEDSTEKMVRTDDAKPGSPVKARLKAPAANGEYKRMESPKHKLGEASQAAQSMPASPRKKTASPTTDGAANQESKERQASVKLLKHVLEEAKKEDLSSLCQEIEGQVFDRFKNTGEEYKSQTRLITFGLQKNSKLLDRVLSQSVLGIELAYAGEDFFEAQ